MLTTEFDLDEYKEVIRMEAKEEGLAEGIKEGKREGIKEGMEKGKNEGKKEGQNYVLELMAQGLSYEEIKKKIEESPKKNHK